MRLKPDYLNMLISKYRAMDIDEIRKDIDEWEEKNDCSNRLRILDIAKNELELKYKIRQEQIELLTQSFTSSSRIGRWISSIKAILY